MAEQKKLVRIVRETQTYIEIGGSFSSSPGYYEKDFRQTRRFAAGKPQIEIVEQAREPSLGELALFGKDTDDLF
jgi:hypothetical protein